MAQHNDHRHAGNRKSEIENRKSGGERLAASLARLRAARKLGTPSPPPLELRPTNAFEVAVAEQLKAIRQDLDHLEARLWWLFALILGAAAANVVLGLLGG